MSKKNEAMNPSIENTEVAEVATSTTYTDVAFAKEAKKHHTSIKAELAKIDSSFEKIAFNLYWFHETKGYEQLGYKSIAEFTAKEYGIAKGTTYNFINVVDRFGERDENGNITGRIAEEYKDYKSSKLIALLDVPMLEQLDEFSADMSVRDIKKKVKELNADVSSDENSATDAPDADADENIIDAEFTEINRQKVIDFTTLDDYNAYLDSMSDLIEKNLKSKLFKDGKHKIEISIVW